MPIKFTPPKMTLNTIRDNIGKIEYDDTCIQEIDFYNRRFASHYWAIVMPIPQEEHTPVFHLLIKSNEMGDYLKTNPAIGKEEFAVLKSRLLMLVIDLITFITDRNIEDASLGDVEIQW